MSTVDLTQPILTPAGTPVRGDVTLRAVIRLALEARDDADADEKIRRYEVLKAVESANGP